MVFFATVWTVAVFCSPMGAGQLHIDGGYEPSTQTITLSAAICRTFDRAPSYDHENPGDAVVALFTLAHEEGHAHDALLSLYRFGVAVDSPDRDYVVSCGAPGPCEAYADCYAASHIYAIARTVGFSAYNARRFRNLAHRSRRSISYATIPQRCWS